MRGSVFDAGCREVMMQEGPEDDDLKDQMFLWKSRCRFCEFFDDPDQLRREWPDWYEWYSDNLGWNPFCRADADDLGRECEHYTRRS